MKIRTRGTVRARGWIVDIGRNVPGKGNGITSFDEEKKKNAEAGGEGRDWKDQYQKRQTVRW